MKNEKINQTVRPKIANFFWETWQNKSCSPSIREMSERMFLGLMANNNLAIVKIKNNNPVDIFRVNKTDDKFNFYTMNRESQTETFTMFVSNGEIIIAEKSIVDAIKNGKKEKKKDYFFAFALLK